MNLTAQQLAQVLIGIARSQQAIVDAIESSRAGFKGTYLAPTLDGVAKIRSGRPATFQELPARVLLQCQGRAGPNVEQIVREIEGLLSGITPAPAAVATPAPSAVPVRASPVAPAASVQAAAAVDSDDLDMTKID